MERLQDFASSVPDFRRSDKGNIRHRLEDIIMLMVLARASGCVGRADIIEFGRHNINKFRKMGMLKKGVPSEATLCRVDNGINDTVMADRMQEFVEVFHARLLRTVPCKEIICIDGKAERGTVQENGRNPDIVSAYSFIDKIRKKGGDFLIELKANQPSLRYGVEDRLGGLSPVYTYVEGPELGHGRIETRTYRVYDGLEVIADKEKWGGNMTIIEYEAETVRKSTGARTSEKRLYVSSLPTCTPALGAYVRKHWSIESMHWSLDVNLLQDSIKRKSFKAARNLDTIQRIVYSVFSIWKGLRKKCSDKKKGLAELMRHVSMSFTRLLRFLKQK